MTVFDEFDKIKTNLPQLLLICGEDDDLVNVLKMQLLELVKFDSEDMSQQYFDLNPSNADLALEELESLPFFSDEKLVIFEHLSNLTTVKKTVFDEKQLKRFETFVTNPLETTQLILIVTGKLDNRLKITKLLKQKAIILEALPLKENELLAYFRKNTALETRVLQLIIEKSNAQFSVVSQNIELLKTFVNGREITIDDVEKVVPKSLQDNIFLLTDLIFRGKISEARNLVTDLLLNGEEMIKILAILTGSFRLYYQVTLLRKKRFDEKQQADFLKIHPYRVKLANQAVRNLPEKWLQKSLSNLIELDYQIKTSRADQKYLFDLALIKLANRE